MPRKIRNTALAVAALAAVALGASAFADAASNSNSNTTTTQSQAAPRGVPPQRSDETLLTDGNADKVKKAALDKVPGSSVIRVETDAEGSPYEAHLRKSDGSLTTVKVNKQFEATKVEDGFGAGGPGGHGQGPGGPPPSSSG
jgi:hypothetical protein